MTQLELAKQDIISPQMERVTQREETEAETIRQRIALGTIVIPANTNHQNLVPCGIGQGLSTKVNANIGTSSDFGNIDTELESFAKGYFQKSGFASQIDMRIGDAREIIPQIEGPIDLAFIDADKQIRRIREKVPDEILAHPPDLQVFTERLHETDNGEPIHGEHPFAALGLHVLAAYALEADVGDAFFQGLHQAGAQQIAGHLTGDDPDPDWRVGRSHPSGLSRAWRP